VGTIPSTKWPKRLSSSLGVSGTYFKLPLPFIKLPYGWLARSWAIAQAAAGSYAACQGQWRSAVPTFLAGATSGVIAKSKEIYNRSWVRINPKPKMLLHIWRQSNEPRPKDILNWYRKGQLFKRDYWRSGPKVPWTIYATGL
jgi:hypothetical protein